MELKIKAQFTAAIGEKMMAALIANALPADQVTRLLTQAKAAYAQEKDQATPEQLQYMEAGILFLERSLLMQHSISQNDDDQDHIAHLLIEAYNRTLELEKLINPPPKPHQKPYRRG